MKVNKICKALSLKDVIYNHDITYITDSSNDVINNSIFVAIKGHTNDGHDSIDIAIKNGAKTIILENKVNEVYGINYIYTYNSKALLARFLKVYYGYIFKKIKIIGVIGTNGKTTTSTLIHNYLDFCKRKSLLIGSGGAKALNYFNKHLNTTPGIVELYSYFNYAYNNKIEYIVMEVSSIGVSELRVFDVSFNCLIFTNFYEDHLDYHKSIDDYFYNKMIPFYKLTKNDYAIINFDDDKYKDILKNINSRIIGYSCNRKSDIVAKNIISNENGLEFSVDTLVIKSNLIGEFNIYNILPLFAITKIFKLNKFNIALFLRNYKQVDGRMNIININNNKVIIDYAHTESAVYNVIKEAFKITKNNLYVVIGCGGNRQRDKRYKIGKLLDSFDCNIILTSDNPRFENPMDIINDIKSGINKDVKILPDRKEAIVHSLKLLKNNDTLLILGKGTEDYIEIKGHFEEYSDYKVVEEFINN